MGPAARAVGIPRPWGVTALFADHTGNHPPLEIDWKLERRAIPLVPSPSTAAIVEPADTVPAEFVHSTPVVEPDVAAPPVTTCAFANFWDFARALNRSDPAALALASDGVQCTMPLEGAELRKLVRTFWFRSVFPRLSTQWRERILDLYDGMGRKAKTA